MSLQLLNTAWCTELPATKKIVLLFLSDKANRDSICWPSIATISKFTGLDRKTVISAISFLENNEILIVDRKTNRANQYMVYPQISTNSGTTENGTSTNIGIPKTDSGSTNFPRGSTKKGTRTQRTQKNLRKGDFEKEEPPKIHGAAYRDYVKPDKTVTRTQAAGLKSIRDIMRGLS